MVGRRLDDGGGGGALLDDAVQRVRRDAHGEGHLLRMRRALALLTGLTVGGLVGVCGVLGAAVAAAVGRLHVRLLTAREERERRKITNVETR